MTEQLRGSRIAEPASRLAARRSFGERLIAALKLDASVYEEVEHDPSALGQSAGVVLLAALASAIGAFGVLGARGILSGLLASLIGWLVWTAIVWLIGVKVFRHSSSFEELLRTLGFVTAPQLLYVIAIIPLPFLAWLVGLVVLAMTLVAFVRAVRQALDVGTDRALAVSALAVLAYLVLAALVGGLGTGRLL